jgi:lysophospholipase L1-like esterase
MKKCKVLAPFGYVLFMLFFFTCRVAVSQPKAGSNPELPNAPFELKNGDRVVFLGNSLFENDFQYGYLELALTTRWPDRDVTFRNLGWTGDNVYGIARSTITNPPTGYELLMEHLTKAAPTLVFIGYGGIEAQEGEAGMASFIEGLSKLLDKTDQLGAKAILLSPIPVLSAESAETMAKQNTMLEVYASAIAKLASERGKRYIDLYKPMQAVSNKATLTDNGIHLNEAGYYQLATTLEQSLGLGPRYKPATIAIAKNTAQATGPIKVREAGDTGDKLTFTLDEGYLPLPRPAEDNGLADSGPVLKITGLKKGFYTLSADKTPVITASAKEWEAGVALNQGGNYNR